MRRAERRGEMCVSGMPRTRIFILEGEEGEGRESMRRGFESRVRPSPNSMETAWDILVVVEEMSDLVDGKM